MPTILQLIVVLFDVCITVSHCSYFHHILCLHLFAHPSIHSSSAVHPSQGCGVPGAYLGCHRERGLVFRAQDQFYPTCVAFLSFAYFVPSLEIKKSNRSIKLENLTRHLTSGASETHGSTNCKRAWGLVQVGRLCGLGVNWAFLTFITVR